LTQKPFSASHWFAPDIETTTERSTPASSSSADILTMATKLHSKFPTFSTAVKTNGRILPKETLTEAFQPERFFTPGWRGDSLPSKVSGRYQRLEVTLQKDVLKLLATQEFNRSLKLGICSWPTLKSAISTALSSMISLASGK
jgi:hypothetical protein